MSADSKLGQQQQRSKKAVPAAGNGSDASRPVLQRTQPKVNQKIPSKISLKTPPDIKKYKSQECNVLSKTSKGSTELASDCCVKELESSDAIESQQQFESSGKTKDEEEISGALCTNLLDDVNGGLEVHASCSSSVGSLTDQEVLLRELSFLSTDETKKTWLNALPATVVPLIRTRTTTHGTSKARKVPPELIAPLTSCLPTKKRCGWLTSQSDPTYIAHHDNEWGVPVHDDKLLFELLVLSGVQAEFNWPLILKMRKDFRVAFAGFDPLDVACFDENKIASLRDRGILKHEWKIRDIVNNAKRCLEVRHEYGSLDQYFWSFVNHKPICLKYRYSAQVPVKTPKSELMSKDLVKRGFRFVGPTIMYSFMQVTGITNDHLVQCFRHGECLELASST